MKQTSLYFQEGNSDKEYNIQIVKQGNGYVVNFQYGRRGNALQSGTKTPSPVSLPEAEQIFEKLKGEKMAKRYKEYAKGGTTRKMANGGTITNIEQAKEFFKGTFYNYNEDLQVSVEEVKKPVKWILTILDTASGDINAYTKTLEKDENLIRYAEEKRKEKEEDEVEHEEYIEERERKEKDEEEEEKMAKGGIIEILNQKVSFKELFTK